jgi:hypothetical protein
MRSVLIATLLVAVPAMAGQEKVSQAMFGDKWPLIVDEGLLSCHGAGEVTFYHKGKTYAVNGLAKSAGKLDIRPIWKDSEEKYVPKKDLGPLINAGLKLCD